MEELMLLVPLFGAVLIGAISPGPSFVLVARTAIAVSRLDGVAAALGMGLGASTFAAGALLGLHAVLTNVPSVYAGFKIIGALYLAVPGRSALERRDRHGKDSGHSAFASERDA